MKRILCIFLCFCTLFAVAACGKDGIPVESSDVPAESSEIPAESSEPVAEEPISVLFLGNSFTYNNDLAGVFDEICKSAGKQVDVLGISIGSARLDWFVTPSEGVCKTLTAKLGEQTFDYVFLQEHSTRPYKDYEAFKKGAGDVMEKILKSCPDCKPILYETWGFHEENSSLIEQGMTTKDQELLLLDAYENLAGEMGAAISYAGVSFYRIYKETECNIYADDRKHPNYAGTYAAALTHFYTLFPNAKQEDVTFCGRVDEAEAKIIRGVCYEVAHSENPRGFLG